MDNKQKIEEIRKKVSQNSLYIARIPEKTKVRFQKIANEEFAGDYGMTVKWLLDFRDGLLSSPNQILMEQMEIMAQKINELESVPQEKPKKKVIKSVSGRIIAEKEE